MYVRVVFICFIDFSNMLFQGSVIEEYIRRAGRTGGKKLRTCPMSLSNAERPSWTRLPSLRTITRARLLNEERQNVRRIILQREVDIAYFGFFMDNFWLADVGLLRRGIFVKSLHRRLSSPSKISSSVLQNVFLKAAASCKPNRPLTKSSWCRALI